MSNIFITSFTTTFFSIFQIMLIIALGAILIRKKIIDQDQVKALSSITVKILLPSMIFSKITTSFDPNDFQYWWAVPLFVVVMGFSGLLFVHLLFVRKIAEKKSIFPLACMQNAAYLILPIGKAVYPDQFDKFAIYVFLVILGTSPFIWSVGKALATSEGKMSRKISNYITPPFVANIISFVLVLSGMNRFIPVQLSNSIDMLGSATVPIATFILGATLGGISFRHLPPLADTVKVLVVKFILIPLLVITVLYLFGIKKHFPLLSDLLVIEASSAPATSLILIIRTYGGDQQKYGSIILISYFVCIFILPFWLAVWRTI